MKVARCRSLTKEGKPCAAAPLPNSDLCPWHTPALVERRRAWSSRGGQARSSSARARKQFPATIAPAEVEDILAWTLQAVIAGRIEPGVATAAASVARAIVAVREAGEVQERLAALEAATGLGGKSA